MMSCAGAGESPLILPCAWRDTLGPQPNSGLASNSNTTSAPPDKPGYERSRKRSNRDPQLLNGYSSAVYLLARHAAGKGTVPGGLKAVICAAEALLPEFVSTIEEALGAPALSEYGSIELGLIACEDRSRTLRVREDTVLVETIPDGLGRYRIVCTNLKNPSSPLLRDDIGALTDEPLGEGSGFHTIGRVLGRDNDCLYTTDGHPVHPEIITHILEHHTAIRRFQARQTTAGEVVLQIETNSRERHVDPVAVGGL